MKDFYVVSYFTNGYEEDISTLVHSLQKHYIPYSIEKVEDKGSWIANANFKPTYLLEMMQRLKAPLIWIDADAEIKKYPMLFHLLDCDLGAHYRKRGEYIELLTGTLFLNYSKSMYEVVKEWAVESERWAKSGVWEQKILQEIVGRKKGKLDVYHFPASYCQIFDQPDMCEEPGVVVHYQASRRYREKRKIHVD
jgi:hypothetical protein